MTATVTVGTVEASPRSFTAGADGTDDAQVSGQVVINDSSSVYDQPYTLTLTNASGQSATATGIT